MNHHTIAEHGRIPRTALPKRALSKLRALDERWANTDHGTVLDWSFANDLRARNYVGVIQVEGASIDILPKIDGAQESLTVADAHRAQRNLVYMLSMASELPIRERDLANLATPNATLLESLIRLFSENLLTELHRGVDNAYVKREENSSVVKGKLLFQEHLRRNIGQPQRLFQTFDEFAADTTLNRVLKLACARLLHLTRSTWTQRCLREALVHFGDVTDVEIQHHELQAIELHRNNLRFESVFEFAKIVLDGGALAPRRGEAHTFSLLFPMEKVFEQFVGAFIKRNASSFGLRLEEVRLQSKGARKWLLKLDEKGQFQLKPDVLIGDELKPRLILDTKWKRLVPNHKDSRYGVSQADIYQLFAYAERYDCQDNILLFPAIEGTTRRIFHIENGKRIRLEFVNTNRDLLTDRRLLQDDFRTILALKPA